MVLNSPWFDMQGSAWLRSPATRVALERLGTSRPMQEIPRKISGVYGRSLHREHGGEWDYDLVWKPLDSRPVYVGWLRAVRRGHAQLHAGLDVDCPTLVLSSARSWFGEQTEETASANDIVLDVEQIRRWASSIGRHVTSIAVDGAMHDVVLSRPQVRTQVYATLRTWLDAWVEPGVVRRAGPPGRSARRPRSRRVAGPARAVGRRWHPAGHRSPTRGRSARPPPSRRRRPR